MSDEPAEHRLTLAGKLSVPDHRPSLPRPLTDEERRVLRSVAAALILGDDRDLEPAQVEDFDRCLERALAARVDVLDEILEAAMNLGRKSPSGDPFIELECFAREEPVVFAALSSVLAGAYLMTPKIREEIGYPGQRAHPPRFDEAAEQIMDGILDPVVERGSIYVPTPPDERFPPETSDS